MEDVLYMNFKNDLSAVINSETLELIEHQGSVNPNMPLRLLLYLGRAYEQLIDAGAKYKTALVKIPAPEFYVFYNRKEEQIPKERIIKKLQRRFNLTSAEAHLYYKKFSS